MEEQPLPVAVSALIHENKTLLIKRNKPPFKGLWGLPGGKVRFGEHVDEAAIREIKEETGIESSFKSIRGIVSEKINEKYKTNVHAIIFVCELTPKSSKAVESREGSLKWFNLSDIDKFKKELIPSDLLFIKHFILKDKEIALTKSIIDKVGEKYLQTKFGE